VSRATGAQKIVVVFSSTAASVIVTPTSMVRMIVSATTEFGQTLVSGTGPLGAVVGECGTRIVTHLSPTQFTDTTPSRGYPPTTAALSFTKSH
jgi:hypothetical protein